MKPSLRRLHSPDLELTGLAPETLSQSFAILVQAMIGPEGSEGEESFDIIVCSGQWISEQLDKVGVLDLPHHLAVERFDLQLVRRHLELRLAAIEGDSWADVATELRMIGRWEFEGYENASE